MASEKLFGGKLQIKPLLVTDKPAERTEVVARLLSPGGELAVLTDGISGIRHLGYLELIPGKARGNHFHKLRHESFYLIAGELELHVQDVATNETRTVVMRAGDMARIEPGVVHTFLPTKVGHALEFASEPFDQADVYRQVLI